MNEIRADAFSKLTLSLEIRGTRSDGFHEIDALMVSSSEPHDALLVRLVDDRWGGIDLSVTGPFAESVGDEADNLALRAALRLLEGHAFRGGIDISLHKGIPSGAGLGGGSADAAAVFVCLRALLEADNVSDRVLEELGRELGADVPFCIRGGAARVRGIGDVLEPVSVPDRAILVVSPPVHCSTVDVYRAWDELGGPAGEAVDVDGFPPLRNDLEPAAHKVAPQLADLKATIESICERPALLAGSGASYAVLFEHNGEAERARAQLAGIVGGLVSLGTTVNGGVALNP